MSSPIQCGRPWLPFLLTVRHWCYTLDPNTSQISRPLFGDKASQPFGCGSVRWEILKSTLPRSATQVLPIFVNATKRVLGYRRPSQCSLTAAALTIVASHHCANQNQHDSDLFVDFLRKWSGTQVSRMRNMTRKQTESKQSGHRCISHRIPWCTKKKQRHCRAWPVHRLGLAETSFAARTCILWVVHKFSATRNSLKHINFCVGKKLWSFNSVLATDHSKMPSAIISLLLSCCGQCGPMRTIDFYSCILIQNWAWTFFFFSKTTSFSSGG